MYGSVVVLFTSLFTWRYRTARRFVWPSAMLLDGLAFFSNINLFLFFQCTTPSLCERRCRTDGQRLDGVTAVVCWAGCTEELRVVTAAAAEMRGMVYIWYVVAKCAE